MEPTTPGRRETVDERADRNWIDLMQELRVAQTGVQLLAGFLVTLPFQTRFARLDDFQQGVYVVLLGLALASVAVMLTPVAIHRRSFGRRVKPRAVQGAHVLTQVALVLISLLLVGIFFFVLDVVVGRGTATVAAGVSLLVLAGLLILLPRWVATSRA